jgi:hypothetical protein
MKTLLSRFLYTCISLFALTYTAYAGTPILTITPSTDNETATVSVTQGDPNTLVKFYYTSNLTNATQYQTLGATDSSGSFSKTINKNSYPIANTLPVYVLVNEAPSESLSWPLISTVSQTAITLSQTNPAITIGQTLSIPVSGGTGFYTITEVANPNVALTSISGSNLVAYGNTVGTTTLTLCSGASICASQSIYVIQATSTPSIPITLTIPMRVGDTATFPLGGGNGSFYLTNPITTPFKAVIAGNNLSITGVQPGTNVATVCSSPSNCQVFMFAISPSSNRQTSSQTSSSEQTSNQNTSSKYLFTSALSPGMKGAAVLQLQNRLMLEGYFTGTPNGYYGEGTTAAVKAYQRDKGLTPLGSVGPGTRSALNAQ